MSDDTIIPRALKKGDTIAFVSPSTRFNDILPAVFSRAAAYLESLGFHVKVIFHGPLKGSFIENIQQRRDELHEAFADTEVKAIICTSGGNHANELLRHLNYELIRANPKIFCGYSDITNLHGALLTQARLRTFYGPTSIELGCFPRPLEFSSSHLLTVVHDAPGEPVGAFPRSREWAKNLPSFVTGKDANSKEPQELSSSPPWKWLRPGKATGRILGGVLTSLLDLAGTKFWPDFNGAILLLESSFGNNVGDPVPLTKTRYQLADLANIGVFDQIHGLVFGRLVGQSDEMDKAFAEILLGQCYGTNFPIVMNVDVGHTDPVLTIPLNSLIRMDSEKDELVGLEPSVVE
ncbi:peptidase S66, LD-carboxypeptidase A [Melanomma pulvis-pyrius CBS 109.77]|uniref:Peptidase S66, LD-carboxypeptidase A n=1 Tax=Melanomma pulvis-pyrius CBS 109.77 TaxID=1314802 RepID=A0A6A6X0K2_9PLEO|nr:peptidase S66, LD-carboxypeptidase A [Melanomma pulvis-pyrius CBS 109.77]